MISELFDKLNNYAHHHQLIFAMIAGLSFSCFTWGFEKLLETYLWPHKPMIGYTVAFIGGLTMLWLVQHYILHAV